MDEIAPYMKGGGEGRKLLMIHHKEGI